MPRAPIPSWYFALVVVRLGHRFLVVQETERGEPWYLPAGRVEPGETLAAAAVRETLEEAGIAVALDGILRLEHTPHADGTARVRAIFLAHPVDDRPPKSTPDEHSLRAAWVKLAELAALPLRGDEVARICAAVEAGMPVAPMSLLA